MLVDSGTALWLSSRMWNTHVNPPLSWIRLFMFSHIWLWHLKFHGRFIILVEKRLLLINQVQKSNLTGTKLCLDCHMYSAFFPSNKLFATFQYDEGIWCCGQTDRHLHFLNIYIFRIRALTTQSPLKSTFDSLCKVYNKYKQREINKIHGLFCWLHISVDALVPVTEGLCGVSKSRSVLAGQWEVRAPAKWNTPFGFHWGRTESPPGCWRGTRGCLQAAPLWPLGFGTSLFCCRGFWP